MVSYATLGRRVGRNPPEFRFQKEKKEEEETTTAILERERGMKREREREKMAIPHDRIPARTSWRRVNLTFAIRSPR